MKPELFPIKDLVMDARFYVRVRGEPWWFTVNKYAEQMTAGAKFPPILIGEFQGTLYVLDGWHRIEALKKNGETYVQGVKKRYDSEKDMFIDSYKANAEHGVPLSSQDNAHIVNALKNYGLSKEEIMRLVKFSAEGLTKMQARTISGSKGVKYLKSPVARLLSEGKITEEEAYELDQSSFSTRSVKDVVTQLINYMEFNAYPWMDSEFKGYAETLLRIIQPHFREVEAE